MFWLVKREPRASTNSIFAHVRLLLVVTLIACSLVVARSLNLHYAVFKMGG
jgi:hypothetical protein